MSSMLNDRFSQMPWDDLDAVVFDVGNVLVVFDPESMLRVLFPDEKELQTRLMERVFRSPYWVMLDRGTLTLPEAALAMAGKDPDLVPEIEHVFSAWPDLTLPIPEGVRAMEEVRAHGKKLFLLSNYNDTFFAATQARHSFLREPFVDGMVISARVREMKPSEAMFRLASDTLRLCPERTVFIDDTAGNVEGALHMGWQGIWYHTPGLLASFMGFSL